MSAVKKVDEFEAIGFVPVKRPDVPPYPMTLPFDWGVDPYNDANWCFQIQTLRYLMVYLFAFRETGEKKYLSILLEWFKDWWGAAQDSKNKHMWHDMATGIRAEKIHQVVEGLKASKIKVPKWYNEMILEHVKVLRKEGFVRVNHNHGLYAAHGLRCLAEHLGPGMQSNVIKESYALVEKIIKNQFDENYVHREHSPHYHHLVLKSLKEYGKTGLYDQFDVLDDYIKGAHKVAENLYLPDGREIPFGDTDNEILPVQKMGNFTATPNQESFWCKSGYAVYKNGATYLCMTNNYNSKIHKHWDNLSIIYGEDGQDIFVDPGKYKYSKDYIREKVLSSESHNTVNLENASWGGGDLIRNSLLLNGAIVESGVKIKGELTVINGGGSHRLCRRVFYKSGLLKITDRVYSDSSYVKKYFSRLNLHKDAKLESEGIGYIYIKIGKFNLHVSFEATEENGMSVNPEYKIDSVPVSYQYGSFVNCQSIKVFNPYKLIMTVSVKL